MNKYFEKVVLIWRGENDHSESFQGWINLHTLEVLDEHHRTVSLYPTEECPGAPELLFEYGVPPELLESLSKKGWIVWDRDDN